MKLKNILGLAIIAGATLFATSAYAATESYSVGTPIDLKTNQPVDEYEVGQIVALPIDFESSTGAIKATGISLNFDKDVLAYGADLNAVVADSATTQNLMALGVVKYNSSQSKVMLVNGLYTSNPLTGNQELGMMNVPDTDTDGKVKIPWASATSVATKDTPELYVIFTVTGTVSSDSLNVDVVSVNNEECNIGDTENHLNINGTVDKANACDGAFKIVVDSEKLPYWVQKVTVDAKGTRVELDACVNSDGTTLYSFPVRFISENEVANADIEIYATVSDDESGVTNVREVNWGAVNVDMSGTVTDYAEANPTIE